MGWLKGNMIHPAHTKITSASARSFIRNATTSILHKTFKKWKSYGVISNINLEEKWNKLCSKLSLIANQESIATICWWVIAKISIVLSIWPGLTISVNNSFKYNALMVSVLLSVVCIIILTEAMSCLSRVQRK